MSLKVDLTRRLCSSACVLGSCWTTILPSGTASIRAHTSVHLKFVQWWPGTSLWGSKSFCTASVSLPQQRASNSNPKQVSDNLPISSPAKRTTKTSTQHRTVNRPKAVANGDKSRSRTSTQRHGTQPKGLDTIRLCSALVRLGKAGRVDEAESLWNQCQADGMLADKNLVGALCANFAAAAEPEKIETVISKAKDAGLFPVPSAYSSLIKAYGQTQQWYHIRGVLIGMIQTEVPINRLHFMAAMAAYHTNSRPNEAEFLLNEMRSHNQEPGQFEFELLADMYAKRKQPHMVEDVLQRWVALGRKVPEALWHICAKAYAYQGEPDQIKRIIAEMRQQSYEIGSRMWSSLLYALVNAGQLEGALEVLSVMQSNGIATRHDYNVIINAHLKRDDEAGAWHYWNVMEESGVRPYLYDFMNFMHYYSSKGMVAAVKVWQEAAAEQGIIDNGECDIVVIEASMQAWWLGGCQNLVLSTAEQDFMQSSSLKLWPIFRYAKGKRGVHNSTAMDLHFYSHWSCQLALLAGLSMMYDRFLNTTWEWPYSEDFVVYVGKGANSVTERRTVKDAAWHFLEKLFSVRMDAHNGAIVVNRSDVLDWFSALNEKQVVLNAVHCKECFNAGAATVQAS